MMCEWETCPQPMEVYSMANGAMTGIHVFFFYFVVTALLACLKLGKRKSLNEEAQETPPNNTSNQVKPVVEGEGV